MSPDKDLLARIGCEFLKIAQSYFNEIIGAHIAEAVQLVQPNGHVIDAATVKRRGRIPKALLEIAAAAGDGAPQQQTAPQQQRQTKPGKLYRIAAASEKAGLSPSAFVKRAVGLGIMPVVRREKLSDGKWHDTKQYNAEQIQQVYDATPLSARRLAERYRSMTPAERRARNKKLAEGRLAAKAVANG